VEEIRHDGEAVESPPDDARLEAGDEVVLAGDAGAFADAAPLFRVGSLSDAEAEALEHARERRMIDTEKTVELQPSPDAGCGHTGAIAAVRPSAPGCEDCLRTNDRWVHLRICMTCGHVGCCDDSPNRHATAHFHATGHPIIEGYDPPEGWGWCYVDDVMVELPDQTPQRGPIPAYDGR